MITATGAGSPIIVTGLTNGTAYTLTVTATNALGTSPAVSSSVTPYTVPGPPAGASATAGNAQATVTFTAPASNGGSAITLYTVTSSPGNITATSTTVTPITVSPLTNGTAYAFTVTAANLAGSGPASSPSSPVTPAGAPGAPTGVSAAPGNAQALVSFTPPASNGSAITGYTVTSYSSGGATGTDANAGSTSTAHTVTGLTNGTAYTFTVTATNVAGTSLPVRRLQPGNSLHDAGVPDEGNATAGNAQATISFSAPASTGGSAITFYTVTSSAGQTASGSSSPITVTGLINGTGYTFTVTATNAAGTGRLVRLKPGNARRSSGRADCGKRNGRQRPGDGHLHGPRINRRRHNGLHRHIESLGRSGYRRRNNLTQSPRDGPYQRDRLHLHCNGDKRSGTRPGLKSFLPCNSSRCARRPDRGERNGRQRPGPGVLHAPGFKRWQRYHGLHCDIEFLGRRSRHGRQRRNNFNCSHRDGAYQRDRLHLHGDCN